MSTFTRCAVAIVTICGLGQFGSGCSTGANAVPGKMTDLASATSRNAPASSSYHVVFNFHGYDGASPVAALTAVGGVLYGTTRGGGKRGLPPKDGVVFSVTTSGEEHVLYSFGESGLSGIEPSASLIDVNDTLYGTTNFGGYSNVGTAYSVTTDGKEQILHSFGKPYSTDGQIPAARLVDMNGTLYGTTYEGGIYRRGKGCGSVPCPGAGTVFSITTAGKVHVLHSFGNGSDGVYPAAGLIQVNGTLYGTTTQGGTYNCGTVFSITTAGEERVLHSFDGPADGTIFALNP